MIHDNWPTIVAVIVVLGTLAALYLAIKSVKDTFARMKSEKLKKEREKKSPLYWNKDDYPTPESEPE
jgi:uncharacterized membrane protein YqjE